MLMCIGTKMAASVDRDKWSSIKILHEQRISTYRVPANFS